MYNESIPDYHKMSFTDQASIRYQSRIHGMYFRIHLSADGCLSQADL